ncbi:MAG: hypothetical protein TQ35_0008215 [Candidatus Aramenus sulfurataquae]|jgi:hypothetical protein|uniref:Uncharacterized protein n=2 Tax=Candidatus Aramenus sulfurataquae TaxID=1326980 RepID=A0A0F2LMH7_9CREN|nr:hypothetical protein [Candidatus Aramenus sulfurataquae]
MAENRDVENRDVELLNKVARFYLQYSDVVKLDDLLEMHREDLYVENLNEATLDYIRLYVTYISIKEILEAAEDALKDKLTYREFSVEYFNETFGELDVDRTILVLPQRTYAYYTYREGTNSIEYRIFGNIIRSVHEMVVHLLNEVKPRVQGDIPRYFDFFPDLNKSLKELKEKYFKIFPEGYFREPAYTDPQWLIKAYNAYEVLRKEVKVGTRASNEKETGRVLKLKFLLWKLYELYVFYILVRVLESEGFTIVKRGNGYEAINPRKRKLYLYFNSFLNSSNLKSVDKLDERKEDVNKFKGRPDISLSNGSLIILECKYSTEPSYITLGRFKIMAYAYEYNPSKAILVYPGLDQNKEYYDEEEYATYKLHEIVEKEGVVEFQYNGKKLYIMKIDPLERDRENMEILKSVLKPDI